MRTKNFTAGSCVEFGGKVIQSAGVYDGSDPRNFAGETLYGYGQSGKSWETTPDGRDGFKNIFLERGYKTFIVDQPRLWQI